VAEAKRKKGETFESLLRRFNKKIQQSGKLIQTRKIRFHAKQPNHTKSKASALRRKEISAQREYLKKIGRLVDDGPSRGYSR
jgi:ribosomal protein S21